MPIKRMVRTIAPESTATSLMHHRLRLTRNDPGPKTPLGEVVPAPANDELVKMVLDKGTRGQTRAARQTEYLHVSDLIGRCIRKIAIVTRDKINIRPQRLSAFDQITFAMGDAIHDTIRDMSIVGGPSMVWGNWKCKCGYLKHVEPCTYAEIDLDDKCERCGTPPVDYVEVDLIDEDLMMVGHPDLIYYLTSSQAHHVVEIKSIKHDEWKELLQPKPDHKIQVLFYWYLMRRAGYRMTDRISVVYVSKGYQFTGSPYKEFQMNPVEEVERLKPYIAEARALKQARLTGTLPARVVCKSEMSTDAKSCEACSTCFATD